MAYRIVPLRLAEVFLQQASPDVQQKIQELLNEISNNPFVDMKTKFYFPAPPVMFTICRAEGFWIVYYLEESSSSLKIINIGYAKQKPTIREP
jgi:mRNA-degrading endonuclease RelE of RelBE toxin-antitoxin system